MVSPTRWTCVWVNSRSWWWTGRPGMLWFMGSQRVRHDWKTELNWSSYRNLGVIHESSLAFTPESKLWASPINPTSKIYFKSNYFCSISFASCLPNFTSFLNWTTKDSNRLSRFSFLLLLPFYSIFHKVNWVILKNGNCYKSLAWLKQFWGFPLCLKCKLWHRL